MLKSVPPVVDVDVAACICVQTSCLHVSKACGRTGDQDAMLLRFKWETQLPEHKSWICFWLFFLPPVDKESCSLSKPRFLSVRSRDARRSHAKQPRHFQVAGRYFLFISFQKKLLALLYADRGKALRFYIARLRGCLQEPNTNAARLWFVCRAILKMCKSLIKFTVNADGITGPMWR